MSLADEYFSPGFLQTFRAPDALSAGYRSATPYPHAVFDDVFKPDVLHAVLREFPDLSTQKRAEVFDNGNERKLASVGEEQFGPRSLALMHFLNSLPFLQFLEHLTAIRDLLPDPQFLGGGFHEIKRGGFLKIHADFNIHYTYKLDRRLNVLVYLNEDWDEAYGGHFELWDTSMSACERRVLPLFNRMVVFSTTSDSFHGHPEPLTCPADRSRRSLALYYYTNGRPPSESTEAHSTVWRTRKGIDAAPTAGRMLVRRLKAVLKDCTPPIVARQIRTLSK